MRDFSSRYGPWAIIAGGSVGLGEAFARALAARGLSLLLLARRAEALETLKHSIEVAYGARGIRVRTAAVDLARPEAAADAERMAESLEVGLVVYNAAHSVIGPFLERPLEEHQRVIDVNCRGPLAFAHRFGGQMASRGHGGIVLMTSLSGSQGNPLLASYAGSKAFNLVLAEGLWEELAKKGVDVLACRAGATLTPGYAASSPKKSVPLSNPDEVVKVALSSLGKGPSVVAGTLNRMAAFALGRLLPRRTSIRIMGRATRRLYG